MDQKQIKQVKKYRILKVLSYFLGFPLFIFITFAASIKYMGRDPYVGSHLWEFPILETQVFNRFQEMISAPALYGVWVVMAIWVFISIVHIIMTKVCKNQKTRTLVVVSVMLVTMLGTVFGMDYAFDKNISSMIDDVNAGVYADGVTVTDYKDQLSYYNRLTSEKENLSYYYQLYQTVEQYERVYAVDMFGYDKCGEAGDMGNTVAYYDELIDDDGNRGVDISYKYNSETKQYDFSLEPDGRNKANGNSNDHVVVRLKPNSKGQLEINGKVYSHYFYVMKTPVTHDSEGIYVWYTIDMFPTHEVVEEDGAITGLKRVVTDGVYGEGIYNPNGLFADGYIPSFYNVLEILEDYYAAEPIVAKALTTYKGKIAYSDYDTWHAAVLEEAELRREEYYTGVSPDENGEYCSKFLQELYQSEMTTAFNRFSLSRGRLDALLAEVGALLGDNALFDLLLNSGSGLIANILGDILTDLANGMLLSEDAGVCAVIKDIFGLDYTPTGLVLKLHYKDSEYDHFYLALLDKDTDKVIMDLDFSNEVLGEDTDFAYLDELGNPAINTDYAFDLDHVSKLLSNALTYLLNKAELIDGKTLIDTVDGLLTGDLSTVLGLVGGLIEGFDLTSGNGLYASLANLLDGLVGGAGAVSYDSDEGEWSFDIIPLLMGLLDSLYYYQTPAIKTVYEFYVDPEAPEWEQAVQKAFADCDRATWIGTYYTPTIGSTIIGDELGGNNDMNAVYKYTSDFGLTDLASVQQLKLDLSYKPIYYPLFTARDLLLVFGGVVIMFYFLSFVAAQKEEEYANGTLVVIDKSKKKSKKNKKNASEEKAVDAPVAEEIVEESAEEVAPKEETVELGSVDSTEEVG